jgi:acyl transferase domain-containing protein
LSDRPGPLAIVGIGCVFPQAASLEEYWSNIRAGRDAITEVPESHWRPEDYFDEDRSTPDRTYARRGGFIGPVDFDPLEFGINPNNLEATDTTQLLGLVAAREALRDAGYAARPGDADGRAFDRSRTSVILGVTGALELVVPLGARLGHPIWRRALRASGVDEDTTDEVVRRIGASYVPWQENSFPGLLGNVTAGRIANRFDLGGTNCVVDAACASSLGALHMATMELDSGRADMVVTGGVDTFNDIFMYMCFSKTPALSPTGNSRPFSADGDGTILGEGLGLVVLKRLADAERDGDRIYAVLRGIGSSSDGLGNAIYAPCADGQANAMRAAYAMAGVTPQTIELIEAHGTGTPVGDSTELGGIRSILGEAGEAGPWCALGSVKSMIGHTKAAAGAAGLIKAALALRHKVLPPSTNVQTPLAALCEPESPVYLNTVARPWLPAGDHPRRAGVSAFGFGGSNFHCVLEEHEPAKITSDWDADVLLFPFSGTDTGQIAHALETLDLDRPTRALRADAAARCRAFDIGAPARLVLVIDRDTADPAGLAGRCIERLRLEPDAGAWQLPEGAFFGSGAAPGGLAVLFPGQGAQHVGMMRELACRFPEMLASLCAANAEQGESGPRLSDRIYPVPRFDEAGRDRDESVLRDTRVAQPALGAVCLGAWRLLERLGLHADALAGHSFGELTALSAAGRLVDEDFRRLARERGRLMGESGATESGTMVAVAAGREIVEALLAEAGLNEVTVANRNAPAQVVLSGLGEHLDRAGEALAAAGHPVRPLAVSAAFHSPLMEPAARAFRAAVDACDVIDAPTPVYANATAAPYPADPDEARDLLASQITRPVEFQRMVERLYDDGMRTFLEVGPGRGLTGLVKATLGDRPHLALALDRPGPVGAGMRGLALAVAAVAATGHEIGLAGWDAEAPTVESATRPGMTVSLYGANHVSPRAPEPPRPPAAVPESARSESAGAPAPALAQPVPAARAPTAPTPSAPLSSGDGAAMPPAGGVDLSAALHITEQSIRALQEMQAETARLQRQYLEGQEVAQQTLARLVAQQAALLAGGLGTPLDPQLTVPQPAPTAVAAPTPSPAADPSREFALAGPSPPPGEAPAAVPAATGPAAGADVMDTVRAVVAEKTGYPSEMLSGGMTLDADLGIDSIKRVEILSALQERLPDASEAGPEALADIETLDDMVTLLVRAAADGSTAPDHPASTEGTSVEGAVLETVADKTGYPAEMLSLEMSLDTDLGIDSIKRVEIFSALQDRLPDAPAADPEDLADLVTLRDVVSFLASAPESAARPAAAASGGLACAVGTALRDRHPALLRQVLIARSLTEADRTGRLTLPAAEEIWVTDDGRGLGSAVCDALEAAGGKTRLIDIDHEPNGTGPAGVIVLSPPDPDPTYVRSAFALLRRVGPCLRQHGGQGGATLLVACRLDGAFGLNGCTPRSATSSGLSGLAKTAAHEWPEVACKVVDLADDLDDADDPARQIAEEFLLRGPLEVGLSRSGRCGLDLTVSPLEGDFGEPPLATGDLVVITGGGRGITAAVATALARTYRPAMLLLGRTTFGPEDPAWLKGLDSEAAIKTAIVERWSGAEAPTPRQVEERYRDLVASREVRETLANLETHGARVMYRALDVRDASSVVRAVDQARAIHGPVRGIVHAAGVLADRLIEDKSEEQFQLVYDTKVAGLEALLEAVGDDDLRGPTTRRPTRC